MDSDLIRGNVDTIILKCLARGESYGVEICNFIREASGGTYQLKQPTLYSALKRLTAQKLVSGFWADSPIGGQRHYYKLTELGRGQLDGKKNDWEFSKLLIDNLVLDRQLLKTSDEAEIIVAGNMATHEALGADTRIVANTDDLTASMAPAIAVELPQVETHESRVVVTTRPVSPLETYVASKDYITIPLTAEQNTAPAAEIKPFVLDAYNTPAASSGEVKQSPPQLVVTKLNPTQLSIDIQKFIPAEPIAVTPFVKHAADKKSGKFVLYNKLRLLCSAVVFAALVAGLVCASLLLKPSYSAEENSFFALGWIFTGVYLLANIALYTAYPKYKKIVKSRMRDISWRAILTACICVAAVSINVIAGLSSVTASHFLVYWVVPCILGSAFLVEGIAIILFKRSRIFLT